MHARYTWLVFLVFLASANAFAEFDASSIGVLPSNSSLGVQPTSNSLDPSTFTSSDPNAQAAAAAAQALSGSGLLTDATVPLAVNLWVGNSQQPQMVVQAGKPLLLNFMCQGATSGGLLDDSGAQILQGAGGTANEPSANLYRTVVYTAGCSNGSQSVTYNIQVIKVFFGVGGPGQASYIFADQSIASQCQQYIASDKDKNCKKNIQTGYVMASSQPPPQGVWSQVCQCHPATPPQGYPWVNVPPSIAASLGTAGTGAGGSCGPNGC